MLADAIAAELPFLRAEAEGRMVDSCTVTRPSATQGPWDDATGTYGPGEPETVYTGRCEVQLVEVLPQVAVSGEVDVFTQRVVVKLPVASSAGVRINDVVTVASGTNDASLAGRTYVVRGGHAKTYATARRLQCEEAT